MKPVKRNNHYITFGLIFLAITLISCSTKNVDEETAVKIYVENLLIEEAHISSADSLAVLKQEIFSKYGVSENDYTTFLMSMKSNEEKWKSFFSKAEEYLEEMKKKEDSM